MSFSIGVSDPNLAPFGIRMRDDAAVAIERAMRFREVALRNLDRAGWPARSSADAMGRCYPRPGPERWPSG